MWVSVRELRNRTPAIISAVESGEKVTLTVNGEPVADIVPHERRSQWLPGAWVAEQLQTRSADPGLAAQVDELDDDAFEDPWANAGS